MDEFKEFVKKNPILINYVKNEQMTWQKFYEIYSLYGEDKDAWKDYIKEEKETKSKVKVPSSFQEFIDMAKNMDVDKVQEGISSLQKAIALFADLIVGKNEENVKNNYQPRPIYRSFED